MLRQNDNSEMRVGASFKQQRSGARCFPQVLSKTANRSSLDIIDQTHPIEVNLELRAPFCKVQVNLQLRTLFHTSFTLHSKNIFSGCCFL